MYSVQIEGVSLTLETAPGLFSPENADRGTLAMLSQINWAQQGEKVLDLGCGCGLVGLYSLKRSSLNEAMLCDIDPLAVELARKNAALNAVAPLDILVSGGLEKIEPRDFTLILSNPPYHTDFAVAKRFIEGGFRHLAIGGRLMMVTKRETWYKNKLTAVFGGVRVVQIDGYYVFTAEKRNFAAAALHNAQKQKLKKKADEGVKRRKGQVRKPTKTK